MLYIMKEKVNKSIVFIFCLTIKNFLFFVTDKIARKADVFDCHVVEVGCGPGSLTRSLLNSGVKHVHGVEIDERFLPSLEVISFF